MEKPVRSPAAAPAPEPRRRPPRPRRPRRLVTPAVLIALGVLAVLGAAGVAELTGAPGGVLGAGRPEPIGPSGQSGSRHAVRRGAPGVPGTAAALSALAAGVPAAPPDLAALIGDRERRVRAVPGDAGAWAVLGAAYVERARRTADTADLPPADKALGTSLRLRPAGNADALSALAVLANERRDFRTARARAEQVLALDPKRWTAYPPLITACTGLGDHKAAQQALDRLTKLDHSPAVRAVTAEVYRDRGWREDAAAQLADAVAGAATPAERAAYVEREGDLAWQRGDLAEALRDFGAALRLDAGRPGALAGRARTLASLGRPEDALAAYRRALGDRPRPELLLEFGELDESLGREEQAEEQYDRVRERAGQDAAAGVDDALVLGRLEADHGDAEAAVRGLRAEWRLRPGTAVADALGWALHRAGQDEEALTFATTATEAAKGGGVRDALYEYHRGAIEQALELPGAARRHLRQALRTAPAFSPRWAPEARTALDALGEPPVTEAPPGVELSVR
ncbi:tetratricopeptide repeat protein [Streptomyces sp. NPDC047017]|uniref:tetratricopeptide repeat protein n=1 Tax=Streptomyces sp. NPDC047017 TaxID=3155024 RepID=UPI0033FB7545